MIPKLRIILDPEAWNQLKKELYPSIWTVMSSNGTFDHIAIGTGVSATTVASKVVLQDGVLLLLTLGPLVARVPYGLDPKKVLVGAAEIIDWNRQMKSKGSINPAPEIDWPDLLKFKRSFSERVPKRREEQFSKSRYNLCPGKGKLRG